MGMGIVYMYQMKAAVPDHSSNPSGELNPDRAFVLEMVYGLSLQFGASGQCCIPRTKYALFQPRFGEGLHQVGDLLLPTTPG
jgi:hypothetical protein